MSTKLYVVGFYYNASTDSVLLIKKVKPEWQKYKLNGIGGKIEWGETPEDAMRRGAHEEANISPEAKWELFATVRDFRTTWKVHFFFCDDKGLAPQIIQKETEQLYWVRVYDLFKHDMIPNLRYLIPLAFITNGELI